MQPYLSGARRIEETHGKHVGSLLAAPVAPRRSRRAAVRPSAPACAVRRWCAPIHRIARRTRNGSAPQQSALWEVGSPGTGPRREDELHSHGKGRRRDAGACDRGPPRAGCRRARIGPERSQRRVRACRREAGRVLPAHPRGEPSSCEPGGGAGPDRRRGGRAPDGGPFPSRGTRGHRRGHQHRRHRLGPRLPASGLLRRFLGTARGVSQGSPSGHSAGEFEGGGDPDLPAPAEHAGSGNVLPGRLLRMGLQRPRHGRGDDRRGGPGGVSRRPGQRHRPQGLSGDL